MLLDLLLIGSGWDFPPFTNEYKLLADMGRNGGGERWPLPSKVTPEMALVSLTKSEVQDFAFRTPFSWTLFELIQTPLDSILSLKCVKRTTQLHIICKLAEGAFDPTFDVTDEDIKQSQYHSSLISIQIWNH
ncbi:hypothetical protein BTVI_03787 [Pitangus sulphuratus]|nr:hypothetical protein BTVI_03787 [Pitangus sulphuratus]